MKNYPITLVTISSVVFISLTLLWPAASFANNEETVIAEPLESDREPNKLSLLETVTIDSQEYIIPESWQDRKLGPLPLAQSPLVMVPPEFVKNNGHIYLLPEARDTFQKMAETAKKAGIAMIIDSGYRSVRYQKKIYRRLMDKGKTFAEVARYVAPPGYSEHMLGLAVDFVPSNWHFVDNPVYQWLKEHGSTFGFNESYPEISSDNRPWEPSHWIFRPTISPLQTARKFK
ncbi:MAG: M15 family metallopeptidase [Desulfocapsa sp.]|nr:M15 family metallopeptidase [Desulfocapsa sp.]